MFSVCEYVIGSVNNMWIILTIILAINSMWLLKLNKDLANRNEYLMKVDELKKAWQDEMDKDTDNKED